MEDAYVTSPKSPVLGDAVVMDAEVASVLGSLRGSASGSSLPFAARPHAVSSPSPSPTLAPTPTPTPFGSVPSMSVVHHQPAAVAAGSVGSVVGESGPRVHVGSMSVVVVSEDGASVQKHFFPSALDESNPLCIQVHEDGVSATVFPAVAGFTVLEGMHLARKEAAAYAKLSNVGVPPLLTPAPVVRVRWPEMSLSSSALSTSTAAPYPWKGAVACLQFANGGQSLDMLAAQCGAKRRDCSAVLGSIVQGVPRLLEALVWYFAHGCIHQDIKITNILWDGSRLSFCGLGLASVEDFLHFMNHPGPYAYVPRDYLLYAISRGKLGVDRASGTRLFDDWAPYMPRILAMNAMMESVGLPPVFDVTTDGTMLLAEYQAYFGTEAVEEGSEFTLRSRMSAVDGYMFGFTMLDFLARVGIQDVDAGTCRRALVPAMRILGAMADVNVRKRLDVRDALSQWNLSVASWS